MPTFWLETCQRLLTKRVSLKPSNPMERLSHASWNSTPMASLDASVMFNSRMLSRPTKLFRLSTTRRFKALLSPFSYTPKEKTEELPNLSTTPIFSSKTYLKSSLTKISRRPSASSVTFSPPLSVQSQAMVLSISKIMSPPKKPSRRST